MALPNELFLDVVSHLQGFKDLNSLVRTSPFFHGMFNIQLYRRAVDANDAVLDDIIGWVLRRCPLASLALLLDSGLSVNRTGNYGSYEQTMLRFLCEVPDPRRTVPLAALLIQRGADLKVLDILHSETVLYSAIERNRSELVVLLLAHGADPNSNRCGDTTLHLAARKHNVGMVNVLLAHGAAIDRRNAAGDTPLLTAVHFRAQDVIKTLLLHGADAGIPNKRGDTPLHYASCWVESEHHELAKSLLEHGAFVNATNNGGETPLHDASWRQFGGRFMVKFLLDNGADVNALSTGGRGCSPLQRAINNDSEDVVALLLEHGADVSVLSRRERKSRSFTFASGKSRRWARST
jgi:ankyrin repeat protein